MNTEFSPTPWPEEEPLEAMNTGITNTDSTQMITPKTVLNLSQTTPMAANTPTSVMESR